MPSKFVSRVAPQYFIDHFKRDHNDDVLGLPHKTQGKARTINTPKKTRTIKTPKKNTKQRRALWKRADALSVSDVLAIEDGDVWTSDAEEEMWDAVAEQRLSRAP